MKLNSTIQTNFLALASQKVGRCTFTLKKLRDQRRQVVKVLLQSLFNVSIRWMMKGTRFRLGEPWQLVNKWNLVYLAHKVFQLTQAHTNVLEGLVQIIQVRFGSGICQELDEKKVYVLLFTKKPLFVQKTDDRFPFFPLGPVSSFVTCSFRGNFAGTKDSKYSCY